MQAINLNKYAIHEWDSSNLKDLRDLIARRW